LEVPKAAKSSREAEIRLSIFILIIGLLL
jgi:hypothetical protein